MNAEAFIELLCATRKCKISSARTTFYNVKRARKLLHQNGKIPRSVKWLPNDTSFLDSLSPTAQKNVSASLVTFIRVLDGPQSKLKLYVDHMNKFARKVDKIYQSGEKSEKQKQNWLSHKLVLQFAKEKARECKQKGIWTREKLTRNDRRCVEDALILSIHSHNPPRLELSTALYSETHELDASENYIIKRPRKGWYAVINVGKTAKGQEIKLSPSSVRILNKFQKHLKHNKPIFTTKSGGPMTRNAYGKRISNTEYILFTWTFLSTKRDFLYG